MSISAMVRLKDEAQFVCASLDSISFCDEIVICLQGKQSDGTDKIVEKWAAGKDKVFIYTYPHDSFPNGPGHDKQPKGVHERSAFYNWCLRKTTSTHVLKWDGDMIAIDLKPRLRGDLMRMGGIEVMPKGLKEFEENCPRYFKVTDETYYVTGEMSEQFTKRGGELITKAFYHFKWMKPLKSITQAWPKNWRKIDHFKRLYASSQ